jgi:hypothetical protein
MFLLIRPGQPVNRLQVLKKRTASVAWLLAVLLVLAPTGQHAAGVVLCIGADGHVGAELAGNDACAGSTSGAGGTDAEHSGACTDLPLPSGGDADCTSFKTETSPTAETTLVVTAVLPALHRLRIVNRHRASAQDGWVSPPHAPSGNNVVLLL